MFTDGNPPDPASTLRTTVSLGCKLHSPPGGRAEQPVANCKKAFLSGPVRDKSTLMNLWNPGLKHTKNRI